MKFIERIEDMSLPRNDEPGRTWRVVIDINMNAVHDYVMYEGSGNSTSWPAKVVEEMIGTLSEMAQREQMIMTMLARKD